jgi:RecA/RadA recombinase
VSKKPANLDDFKALYSKRVGAPPARLENAKRMSFGLLALDLAHQLPGMSCGYYAGSVIRIAGAPGLGKSSLTYKMAAEALKRDMNVLFVDSEAKFNELIWASSLADAGVDASAAERVMYVRQGDVFDPKTALTVENLSGIITDIMQPSVSPNGAFVIIDSVDSLPSEMHYAKQVDESVIGTVPRILKNMMRLWRPAIVAHGHVLVFVHQAMANIGASSQHVPVTYGGGYGLAHAADIQIVMKHVGNINVGSGDDRERAGRYVGFDFVKSTQGKMGAQVTIPLRSDIGFDWTAAIVDYGTELGIISASGSWLRFKDEKGETVSLQGANKLREALSLNPALRAYLEEKVRNAYYEALLRA